MSGDHDLTTAPTNADPGEPGDIDQLALLAAGLASALSNYQI
jgi:hypothetical protein